MLEHMDKLSETAATAISKIKFDKIVVWDGQQGKATSGFLQNLGQSLPPMLSMMKDVGGIEMPEFFGKILGDKKDESNDGDDDDTSVATGPKSSGPKPPAPKPAAPRTPKDKPAK